jgi:hypothetical protein
MAAADTLILRNSQGKQLGKHTFSVDNPAHPPVLNEAEVIRCPENDLYFQIWSMKPNGRAEKGEEVTPSHRTSPS